MKDVRVNVSISLWCELLTLIQCNAWPLYDTFDFDAMYAISIYVEVLNEKD